MLVPSIRYKQPNLFEDYKKSIQFFTSSIVRVAEEDILLDSLANDESATNELSENLYIKYWEILNEACSEFPHLEEILKNAMKQTIEMLNKGVYVDNHYAITPLGWVAGNHEEVRNYCNKISLKILEDIPEESFVNCLDEFEEF